jgi:hypothetical protein
VIAGSLLMLAVLGTFFESAHTAQDGSLLPSATKGKEIVILRVDRILKLMFIF